MLAAILTGGTLRGIREDIAQAEQDIRTGRTFGEDEIRAEFGVPKRPG